MPANYQGQFHSPKNKYRSHGGAEPDKLPRIWLIGWSVHETLQRLPRKKCLILSEVNKICLTFTDDFFKYFLTAIPSTVRRYEKIRLCEVNPLQIQSPETKRAHSRQFVRAKKLPFPQQKFQKKKGGLNKKVTSAVFRAWTDKQKKFYVCAKRNLTLQTSSIHWNILPPITVQRKVPRI